MVNDDVVQAFNSRIRVDLNNTKKMTPAQLDRVKTYGTQAENMLMNKDFVQFIHHWKFDTAEAIGSVSGHTEEDNARRVALSNQLAGIDSFIASLQRAKYYKDRVVSQQQQSVPEDPTA